MRSSILYFFIFICVSAQAQKIKVACIGNSVTYGSGIENRETDSYPAQLQRLLGDTFEVVNFGIPGATLLKKGHRPYTGEERYREALAFAADYVVIHLGLNDTDPRNWPHFKDDFIRDYAELIRSFRNANPKSKIWICRLSPITHEHSRFKSGTRDWYWQIQQAIEQVADYEKTGLIDLQSELYVRPDLLPDALHPTAEGAGVIARTVYGHLTGDFGGLQLSALYTDNMVLQRDKPLRISGKANAGEKVNVQIGNHKKHVLAGGNGQWQIVFPAMPAGGPYELKIQTRTDSRLFKNVLIGEVWICSGQSNMAFTLGQAVSATEELDKIPENRVTPVLRFFDMKARWQTNPVEWSVSALDSTNHLQYYRDTRWTECSPRSAQRMSAIAYYFGKMLADSLQVPVGLIHNAVGGSTTESWIDRKSLEFEFPDILHRWTENDMIQPWARERAALNIKKSTNKQQRHPYGPCYLFEAGILPLDAYTAQGIIWYQGESNAHNMEIHEILFPLLVKSWRQYWQEELPFYYVQLSSIDRPGWPGFRDSQRRMMYEIPNTGMAVSSDKGDSLDVHPVYKKEVGERLARWALFQTYGHVLTPSGPLFKEAMQENCAAVLSFDYAEGLHPSDGNEITGFEIAETEGIYFPARTEIRGKQIKITSSAVKHPRYVRYGWQPFSRANLVNGDELPASTFKAAIRY